jgi:hypothetical protein
MKILSIVIALGGIVCLLIAAIVILQNTNFLGGTGAGYIRLSSSLFLFAIVVMMYDKIYLQKNRKKQ